MPKPDGVVLVAFLAGCGASAAGKIPALQGTNPAERAFFRRLKLSAQLVG
jgi:hypothetical protein